MEDILIIFPVGISPAAICADHSVLRPAGKEKKGPFKLVVKILLPTCFGGRQKIDPLRWRNACIIHQEVEAAESFPA